MAVKEGKLQVLRAAVCLDLFGLLCLIISFVTPYWIISWPRVYSGFRRMGLWEVCFAGLVLEYDPTRKAYHGCWWILAPEIYAIRSWIMPPWFIVVQILISICLVVEIVLVILDLILWLNSTKRDDADFGKRRAPYNIVQTVTWMTVSTAIMKTMAILIFGLAYKYDPFWIPKPEINYPHFSYGLAIVSSFMSIFSSMAHFKHRNIVRDDDYANPAVGGAKSGQIYMRKV